MIWPAINTLSEYNNFIILGPQMRSFFIFILQILFIQNSIAQSLDAKTNSLGSCGLTQTTVWSNLENQAGLASINKLVFGIGSRKQFLIAVMCYLILPHMIAEFMHMKVMYYMATQFHLIMEKEVRFTW